MTLPTFAEGVHLACECGSTDICVCATMPIFVYAHDGRVTKVAPAPGPTTISEGVARCLSCERFWILDSARLRSPEPFRPEFGAARQEGSD